MADSHDTLGVHDEGERGPDVVTGDEEMKVDSGGAGGEEEEEEEYNTEKNWEFLDHTADVQIHSWGDDVVEAFAGAAHGMFDYMTEIESIDRDGTEREIKASGHDMQSLLYNFLDEVLFQMTGDYYVLSFIDIVEFDRVNWQIRALGYGEPWDSSKHPVGTEIKAITYSHMQIYEHETGGADIYVIVDI